MAELNPVTHWRRFLALPNESRAKALGVALLVALVSAGAVSITAVTLRPLQEANADRVKEERLTSLLANAPGLAGIVADAGATGLETRIVDLTIGDYAVGTSADEFDIEAAAADPSQSIALAPDVDIAGIRRRANFAEVHILFRDENIALIVLPIHGSGYQSTIYAFLALQSDLRTVAALSVYDQGETPGLGARITEVAWQDLWPGKQIADETGAIRIEVVRGRGVGVYEIDGITGATRTSSAVSNIVRFWLGEWGYGPFLATLRSTLDASATPAAPVEIETPPVEVAPAEVDAPPILAFLADRHAETGFSCGACHSDGLPAPGAQLPADLSAAVCLGCHGTFAEVAGRTDAISPNPHASHLGDLDCTSCHRAHAQSVDYCEQCHSFGFRVP